MKAKKKKRSKEMLSSRKIEIYDGNARTIEFYRNNPCIASEELIGVKLLDAQKIILNRIWVADYSVLACSLKKLWKIVLGECIYDIEVVTIRRSTVTDIYYWFSRKSKYRMFQEARRYNNAKNTID